MAVDLDRPAGPRAPRGATLRSVWRTITAFLVLAAFLEAVFAGAMLSGIDGARAAHALTAAVLVAATLLASVLAILTLYRMPDGRRLGLMLMLLAAMVFAQAVIGALTAKSVNLLWLHIPLGVAVFGLAVRIATRARDLNFEVAR
ncbi:MAG TPA: hypothetical protein VHL34_06995 [Rhizomicrobium sp.]|jgi:hypothetical protein|nr:hypothetical protein [Rhizomicrobium sp.]